MAVTQPLILLDEVAPEGDAPAHRKSDEATMRSAAGAGRRRWRSAAAWSAALIVAVVAGTREPPPAPEPSGAAVGSDATTNPVTGGTLTKGLVVRAMPPNEAMVMFRNPGHGFCGDLELHLDGVPVPIGVLVETDAQLLVTFAVPAQAAIGPHDVALIGGIPAPKATGACRDGVPHRRTIAATTAHI